jgi:divalent metal cation (Fe/Co/Zn/Cd) transporter
MVAGTGFSFIEAYQAFTGKHGGEETFLPAYIMLAIAFLLEGSSWLRAMWQTRKEAAKAQRGFIEHIRVSADPTVKTVASEDSAALVGIVLAFAGLGLHEATGQEFWEGIASLLIGCLLVVVADDRTIGRICDILGSYDGVDEVLEVLTMRVGTGQVLVAVRLDFIEDLSAEDVEELSTEIDRDLHEHVPEVYQVFLDATDKDTRRQRGGNDARPDGDRPRDGAAPKPAAVSHPDQAV